MRLFVKRFEWDQSRASILSDEVVKFLAEVDAKVADLTRKYSAKAA
jgi:hypothetical protein